MSHLECIHGQTALFDYRQRDALTGNARICIIENI